MQFDADHLFALAGYAKTDPDIMENHIRNGVPDIAEREFSETIEVLRMFKGDDEWAWLVEKLRANVRKLSRAVAVYRSNQGDKTSEIENSLFIAYNALLQGRLNDVKTAITHSIMWVKKAKAEK